LAVAHGIAEQHKGVISAESFPGKGAVFTILFPAYEGPVEQAREAKTVLPTGNERILFVDDEPAISKLGKQRLEKLGYRVQSATDPSEALAIFKDAPDAFDLIITDMAMPHMTGEQLATEILKIRPGMPIMLCTGHSEKVSEKNAREIGICSFVMKPMEKAEFAVRVRKVLDESEGTPKG
jgi:DNA-binding response OmpR family regulator